MKFSNNPKHLAAILIFACAFFAASCQKQPAPAVIAQTPTDAYKMIYNGVKAKQTATIKSLMSDKTISLAQAQAQQQSKPPDSVFENGFTATTFSPTMPDIRDERVKGEMGAIEVYNSRDSRWEDLPFIKEKGGWKLAVGDIFAGTYQSPGKSMSQIEAEASNTNTMVPLSPNINGKFGADKMKSNSAAATNSR